MKLLLPLLLLTSTLFASIAQVEAIFGHATLLRKGESLKLKKKSQLQEHDEIKTDKNSKLQIRFNDNTIISLGQNSHFRIDEYLYEDKNVNAKFSIAKGFFKSITGKIGKIAPNRFKIKTANATIGVRGTTIIAEVTPNLDIIACTQGQIVVTTQYGSVVVDKGERTVVKLQTPPTKAQKVNPILLKKLDQKSNPFTPPSPTKNHFQTPPSPTKDKDALPTKEQIITTKEEQKSTQFSNNEVPIQQPDEETNFDTMRAVIGTNNPVYEGIVTEGSTSYGEILQNEKNHVKLGFDLGAGTMQGDIHFEDRIQNYAIEVGGKLNKDGSFRFNSQNGYNGGGEGRLEKDAFKEANGAFRFEEEDLFNHKINKIEGKFQTTR